MLKKRILLAAIIAITLLGFFYNSLLNHGLRYYIDKKSRELALPLCYSKVEFSPHQIVFINPEINVDGGFIKANRLTLNHNIDFLKRHVDLNIGLDYPEISLEGDKILFEKLFNYQETPPLFTSAGQVNCSHGTFSKNNECFSFAISHSWTSKHKEGYLHEGTYSLNLNDQQQPSSMHLAFQASSSMDIGVKANLHQVKAERLAETLKAFIPELSSWTFKQGLLDGAFEFVFKNAQFAHGQGELAINHLELEERNLGLEASIQKAIFRTHSETQHASLNILDGGYLYFKDSEVYAAFKDFQGNLTITESDRLEMDLKGIWEDEKAPLETKLKGHVHLAKWPDLVMNISIQDPHLQEKPSFIHVTAKELGGVNTEAKIALQGFGPKQFLFWQRAIENLFPGVNPVSYHRGTMDALLHISFDKEQQVGAIKIENIDASNVFFVIKKWEAALGADRLSGQLAINFTDPNPQNTLNADINITNGQAALIGLTQDFWQFHHIETQLSVRNGIIQRSSASVELAGLKGSAEVSSFSENEILHLKLQGQAIDLKPFLPRRVQAGINRMNQDLLTVNASVFKTSKGVNVLGELKVQDPEIASPPIAFSFDLERSPFEDPSLDTFNQKQEISALLRNHSLSYLKALFQLDERLLLRETGIHGFVLRNGIFSVKNLSLERFVSPFLFPDDLFALKGFSNIEGSFDYLGLAIRYNAHHLSLENDALSIAVEHVIGHSNPLPAHHYFDFSTGKHFGELPLANASYFEKNSGLLFTDVDARVLFEEKGVHLLDVETFSNGIFFGGGINVNYLLPQKGAFNVELLIDTLYGKCSQLQHFFSHFNKSFFFNHIPLEGDVSLRNKGCRILLDFPPHQFFVETQVEGHICDATLTGKNLDLSLQDLSLNFSYDSSQKQLSFSDLQAAIITSKPSSFEEYSLQSNRIHFSNLDENEAEFDIWVKDHHRDLARLKGSTSSQYNQLSEKEIVFSFDQEYTHFGEIQPKKMALFLKDWTKIARAKMDFSFRLSNLLYDLHRFGKSGLLLTSSHFFKELGKLKNAGGECDVSLTYDASNAIFDFSLQGSHLTFDQFQFKNVMLVGKNQDRRWSIDQLQLDQLSLSAELIKHDTIWKAHFLGIRYGQSLLLGMQGEYQEGSEYLKAQINLFEGNLAKLNEWPFLVSFSQELSPSGLCKGSGELLIKLPKNEPLSFDLDLNAYLHQFKLKEISFNDTTPFFCHFSLDQGLTISNLNTAILGQDQPIPLHFDHLQFDSIHQAFFVTGLNFAIPAPQLSPFISHLHTNFPCLLSPAAATILKQAKQEGSLAGELNLQRYASHTDVQIKFKDDKYRFGESEHFLRSFTLNLTPQHLLLSADYTFNQHEFSLLGKLVAPSFGYGEIILRDPMHQDDEFDPLWIDWHYDQTDGFIIDHAKGHFAGMHLLLSNSSTSPSDAATLRLDGNVRLLSDQFHHLLDASLSEQVLKWQVGQGYELKGSFGYDKEGHSNGSPLSFFGTLTGNDFHLKGYQFKALTSQVKFTGDQTEISQLKIVDPACSLQMDKLLIAKDGLQSHLHIPQLTILNLRPSSLVEVDKPSGPKKPLIITELIINDLKGTLGDETSFIGKGLLNFSNPVKKHLQNTIFAFPAEILTRIGLDLSVLTPVVGTIYYDIHDGKVYLTKFKDVYSHSRLSRFYLPNSRTPSYMDFEGNLNIQVKMKQHTLLFKLAELFTVTIQGNLQNPTYTLLRQKPLQRSEVIASSESGS
ncbi:MAG: hypothetical protein ACSNEK_03880 [Parachlamydiaceae bacterium]